MQLHEEGVHVISIDEMTGIQALERKYPTKTVKPDFVERREFEYIRHGTQSLIGNFEVATGKVVLPYINATRTEEDFARNIKNLISQDPEGKWIFILDQLNTHKFETLVKLVTDQCNITEELGKKGVDGILKSQETRANFLSDPEHRIRFVYTPKHASWLNQIEIWFSILMRRLLKRGNFSSVEDLKDKICKFINYYNITARAFKWTYSGKPLTI